MSLTKRGRKKPHNRTSHDDPTLKEIAVQATASGHPISKTKVHAVLNQVNEAIIAAMSQSLELGLSDDVIKKLARSEVFDRHLAGVLDKLEAGRTR